MDMSYKEKSLLASLGATLLVFGWYFYQVFSNQMFNIGHEFTFNDIFLLIQLLYVGSGGWYDILENSSPAFISHLLLLFIVLAEVTNFITQLYHYRKGI